MLPLGSYQQKKVDALFDMLDTNENGFIDFGDFMKHAHMLASKPERNWPLDGPQFRELFIAKSTFWALLTSKGGSLAEEFLNLGDPQVKVTKDQWKLFWEKMRNGMVNGRAQNWMAMIVFSIFKNIDTAGDGKIGQEEYFEYLDSIGVRDDSEKRNDAWQKVSRGQTRIDMNRMEALLNDWLVNDTEASPVDGDYFPCAGFKVQWS